MFGSKGGIFPFGMQNKFTDGGQGPTSMMNLLYSMGMPGWTRDGGWSSVYQDQFMKLLREGKNPIEGMGWGSGGNAGSNNAVNSQRQVAPAQTGMNWSFPQYSQSWAFKPPVPSPYNMPPPFKGKR